MVSADQHWHELVMDMDGELKWYKEADYRGGSLDLSGTADLILMQYTGLKDKNGKEIWEGDVVEAKSWVPARYLVEFIEGGFCFTSSRMKGSPIDINLMFSSVGCACEVIGNIYQHHELIQT